MVWNHFRSILLWFPLFIFFVNQFQVLGPIVFTLSLMLMLLLWVTHMIVGAGNFAAEACRDATGLMVDSSSCPLASLMTSWSGRGHEERCFERCAVCLQKNVQVPLQHVRFETWGHPCFNLSLVSCWFIYSAGGMNRVQTFLWDK